MEVGVDLLSLLPDSLLSTIVSSLSFKEAVRTSILSKGWENIYRLTTNIEFNELFFVNLDQPLEVVNAQRKAFATFVRKWIENHSKNIIEKFSLRISKPEEFSHLIDECFQFAIKNEVKDLEVDFTYPTWINEIFYYNILDPSVDLPTWVYGYNRLESLKLYSCNFIASEMVNNFHSLKEISFGYMKISMCCIKHLLTHCKMLESLSFTKCWNSDEGFDLKDEYLNLKKLVIHRCYFRYDQIFRVNAPNLKVFKYYGLMSLAINDIRTPLLDEVDLDFSPEHGFVGHGPFLYNFLKDFISAKVLTICSYFLQVIYTGGRPKRMYRSMNVKHLTMKTALHKREFMGITFMLNSCPFLERLTIEISEVKYLLDYEKMYAVNTKKYWSDPLKIHKCMKEKLKEIEIKGFRGTTNEINMISYFIMHGKALRKLSINIRRENGERENGVWLPSRRRAAKFFRTLPHASPLLRISIT